MKDYKKSSGYQGTILTSAVSSIDFQHTYWIEYWINQIGQNKSEQQASSFYALSSIAKASKEVVDLICSQLKTLTPRKLEEVVLWL